MSLFGTCTLFCIDRICLFYEIRNEIPSFHRLRFESAIPRIPRLPRDRRKSPALYLEIRNCSIELGIVHSASKLLCDSTMSKTDTQVKKLMAWEIVQSAG